MTKRCFDIVVAFTGLVLCSPILLLVAALIKLENDGPVFFCQERVGKDFKLFQLLKFRTMCVNAEVGGRRITVEGDSRVTKIGQWLRATKADELPQLWNVLRGEMSIVGPRPEVAEYVDLFRDDYQEILSVRPGITDISSILFRRESELLATAEDPVREYIDIILPQKIRLSSEYIRKRSTLGDIYLLWQTVWVICFPNRTPKSKEIIA